MPERRNWKRVALEVVVIVGSILLAFGIQAWWDGRQAAALEQELLTSLADGFEENRRQAEAVIGEARRQQTLIGRFIGMSAVEAERISPDSVYMFLRSLWRPNYVTPIPGGPQYGPGLNNAALLATLEAGRLPLLSDSLLLNALAQRQGVADKREKRSAEVIALEREVLAAVARIPELQSALAGLDEDGEFWSFGASWPRLAGSVARRAREDNELMSRATRKGFYSRVELQDLEGLMTEAGFVLALVRENQRR